MKRIMDRGHDGGTVYRWETISKFVLQHKWKVGVEIGVWKGETFKYLLKKCPDLYLTGVDLYAPQPGNNGPEKWTKGENGHAWDHQKYYEDLVKFCENTGRGNIIKNYSVNAAKQISDDSLNFVFIDGDHSYEGVRNDIIAWLPKIKKGGYIIGHDIHFDSVKTAVTEIFDNNYKTADDFIWYIEV
jgi:hypothetical protein